jgi:NifB/MoaA-like Fe-S oxidoreductase
MIQLWHHPVGVMAAAEPFMMKRKDDGLEWLREIRRKIAAKCGNDVHAINEYYRAAAARIPHRSYRGPSTSKRGKRKVLPQK